MLMHYDSQNVNQVIRDDIKIEIDTNHIRVYHGQLKSELGCKAQRLS